MLSFARGNSHCLRYTERFIMSFKIGKIYEGLHDGRWFICTILSQEDEGYKVSFKDWSSKFIEVLKAECICSRSTEIDCPRNRKRQHIAPAVNFNKLLPEDCAYVDEEGTKKPAIVRIIDPFLEILTVEIEDEEALVPFESVVSPDNPPDNPPDEPAVSEKRPRKSACIREASPSIAKSSPPPPPPEASYWESSTLPQFISILPPDGVEISCGDLVKFAPSCTDLAFMVTEICLQDSRKVLKAQKCEVEESTALKLSQDFTVTCPVTSVNKLELKTSPVLSKTAVGIRGRAILRCAESLRHHAGNHPYQLRYRQHELAARIREEVRRSMTAKAARTSTIKLGPASLSTDLELLSLKVENGFKSTKSRVDLADLDTLFGRNWDVKVKPDKRFFYVTLAEFMLDVSSRSLAIRVKFAESTCTFHPDRYRTNTDTDCS